jgi:hypothetical protein
MHIFSPRMRVFTFLTITYFVAFFALAIFFGNTEFLFYETAMALIIATVVLMDIRVEFSRLVLAGLTLWGFLHLSGGLLPIPPALADGDPGAPAVLYNLRLLPFLPKYDQIVHALGFGMTALAAHEALQVHLQRKLPMTLPVAATLFFIALGLGALNEVIEFCAVLIMPQTNVGGYMNTGWDLISNSAGALIAVLYLKCREGK